MSECHATKALPSINGTRNRRNVKVSNAMVGMVKDNVQRCEILAKIYLSIYIKIKNIGPFVAFANHFRCDFAFRKLKNVVWVPEFEDGVFIWISSIFAPFLSFTSLRVRILFHFCRFASLRIRYHYFWNIFISNFWGGGEGVVVSSVSLSSFSFIAFFVSLFKGFILWSLYAWFGLCFFFLFRL